ncbi:MAG: glycosyltransferase family 2 protein [Acidobacteria bacterium]|nr:glycosyltransferase family 2 protein [Acidobacteriota bacterium]
MSEDALSSPLTIVIPAYGEARRLGGTLRSIATYFRGNRLSPEIVVIDDGSRDATSAVARQFFSVYEGPSLLLVNHRNRGKGYSVRRGILAASGERVLISDADLSTPIEEVYALLERQEQDGCDIVIGSRALPGSRIEVHQSILREKLGKLFNLLMRGLSGLPFRDTQCGFKLMTREVVQPVVRDLKTEGFAYDVELVWRALRAGLSVVEHPVRWRNSAGSSVGLLTDAPRMLLDLLRLRRWMGGTAGSMDDSAVRVAGGRP